MPESYRPHLRRDDQEKRTATQSIETNTTAKNATVRDVLKLREGGVFAIGPQETLHKAVEMLRDHRIGALLVTDAAGVLLGILSERDIVRKLADSPGKTLPHRVEEVMTKNVVTCMQDDDLVSVLRRMTEGRFRHMPVVDGGKPIRIITIGDAVNYRLNQLELEALQIKQLIVG